MFVKTRARVKVNVSSFNSLYFGFYWLLPPNNQLDVLNPSEAEQVFYHFNVIDDGSDVLEVYHRTTGQLCYLMQRKNFDD